MKYCNFNVKIELSHEPIEDWNYSSAIRGIFGRSLKQIYCIQRNIKCDQCSFSDCLYFELFEKKYGDYQRFHPYIIRDVTKAKNSNDLIINFTFIGKLCDQISQLLHGIMKIQKYALFASKKSHTMKIKKISDSCGKVIYDESIGKLEMPEIIQVKLEKRPVKKLLLNIETPFRIKYRNKFMQTFVWHAFLQTLYKRMIYLNQYYCSSECASKAL